MVVNYKEIPAANITNGDQDTFELFARDFLFLLGYKIESEPNRGADNGADLIVSETVQINTEKTIVRRWLVSCKHLAHSGKSVQKELENDIPDRLEFHKCQGFMGFYSTVVSAKLNSYLNVFKDRFSILVFDKSKIEDILIGNSRFTYLFQRFFPESYKGWNQTIGYFMPIGLLKSFLQQPKYYGFELLIRRSFGDYPTFIKNVIKCSSFAELCEISNLKLIVLENLHHYVKECYEKKLNPNSCSVPEYVFRKLGIIAKYDYIFYHCSEIQNGNIVCLFFDETTIIIDKIWYPAKNELVMKIKKVLIDIPE